MRFGLDNRASDLNARCDDTDLGRRFMHDNLHKSLTIPRIHYITFASANRMLTPSRVHVTSFSLSISRVMLLSAPERDASRYNSCTSSEPRHVVSSHCGVRDTLVAVGRVRVQSNA